MTYTGCSCDCHPESAARNRPLPPAAAHIEGSTELTHPVEFAPPRSPEQARRAARAVSHLLIGQGTLLILGLLALLALALTGSAAHKAENELGILVVVAFASIVLPVAVLMIGTGLCARGRGMTCPVVGIAAHALLTITVIDVSGSLLAGLEFIAVTTLLLWGFSLGQSWWRSPSPERP